MFNRKKCRIFDHLNKFRNVLRLHKTSSLFGVLFQMVIFEITLKIKTNYKPQYIIKLKYKQGVYEVPHHRPSFNSSKIQHIHKKYIELNW